LRVYFLSNKQTVKAVDGVSLSISRGEIFGLVGESGCGKSTTGFAIVRLVSPPGKIVGGRLLFKNENLLDKTEDEMRQIRGREISMIFQEPTMSLNPVLSVGDQLSEAILLHVTSNKKEALGLALDLLKKVGVADAERVVDRYPHELSGGMAQRVMIAMAFSCSPDLVIADEPTTALDVTTEAQILELLKEMVREIGTSALLITHDLGIVAENCTRVGVMYAGKVVEIADVSTIFKTPQHPYTVALLEAIPKFRTRKAFLNEIKGDVPSLLNPPSGCRFHPRCEYAMDICARLDPPLVEVGSQHFVSCTRYNGAR
jgi:oligopeptide/dipeptide ABC transporter ATP-binding protein